MAAASPCPPPPPSRTRPRWLGRDYITRDPIRNDRTHWRCRACEALYNPESVKYLVQEDGGRCWSCNATGSFLCVPAPRVPPRTPPPDVVPKRFVVGRDAITREKIFSDQEHWRCETCESVYTAVSHAAIRAAEPPHCWGCQTRAKFRRIAPQSRSPTEVTPPPERPPGPPTPPPEPPRPGRWLSVRDLPGRHGQIVRLEAEVLRARPSRRGNAVFLDLTPGARHRDRVKIVLFQTFVAQWDGEPGLLELTGRRVRCTGRYNEHPFFGPGIIASALQVLPVSSDDADHREDAETDRSGATPTSPTTELVWRDLS